MNEVHIDNQIEEDLMLLCEFLKHFNTHYTLLLQRYVRFKAIDEVYNTDIDISTYFDMIIVQLRAICIERPDLKNNYTAQILLRKVGEFQLADKLDAMLEEPFLEDVMDLTIRKAIKTLADQFICHYDNFDSGDGKDAWAMHSIIEQQLRSPYNTHNLDYIMDTLIGCIGEGLSLKSTQ